MLARLIPLQRALTQRTTLITISQTTTTIQTHIGIKYILLHIQMLVLFQLELRLDVEMMVHIASVKVGEVLAHIMEELQSGCRKI